MDRTALILLLFDADKEDVLPGLGEWQTALRRCGPAKTPLLLIAGRTDVGFQISSEKLQDFTANKAFATLSPYTKFLRMAFAKLQIIKRLLTNTFVKIDAFLWGH